MIDCRKPLNGNQALLKGKDHMTVWVVLALGYTLWVFESLCMAIWGKNGTK